MCRNPFESNRYWYCSDHCRWLGTRIPNDVRPFVRLVEGQEVAVPLWRWRPGASQGGDTRWLAGPPPHPLHVFVTSDGVYSCPECRRPMDTDGTTQECWPCDLMLIPQKS